MWQQVLEEAEYREVSKKCKREIAKNSLMWLINYALMFDTVPLILVTN